PDVHGRLRRLQRAPGRGGRPPAAGGRDLQADRGADPAALVGGERDRRGHGDGPGRLPGGLPAARAPARRIAMKEAARAYGQAFREARTLLAYTLLVSLTLFILAPFAMI